MNDKLKNGILIGVGVLLLVNIGMMIMDDDGVSYDKAAATNEAAVTPAATNNNLANNQADVVNTNAGPKTTIKFEEMEHDFGNIEQDTRNTKVFTFTNTGDEPLIISNAKGSCGCTVPRYPREPVAPGETGEIEVVYSPSKQKNQQTKTVSITANTEPATTILKITAYVNPGEEGGAESATSSDEGTIQIGG